MMSRKKLEMVDTTKSGTWKEVGLTVCTARVKKAKDDLKVTVQLTGSVWNAEFKVGDDKKDIVIGEHSVLSAHTVLSTQSSTTDIKGNVRYKQEKDILNGKYVRWDHDHLIFYESDTFSTDWTAYVRFSSLGFAMH